jgi:hypothetical protein
MSSKKRPAGASQPKPPVPVKPTEPIPPAPEADVPDLLPMTVYHVKGDLVSVAFGDQVYPVKDGRVKLPTGAQWYAHLVQSGRLFQE